MPGIYLDSNVYIIGLLHKETNAARILGEILDRDIPVVQSDYLFDEVLHWFKSHEGKDMAGLVRTYLLTIPNREYVSRAEWSLFLDEFVNIVGDKDDPPHICCNHAASADAFVTTNRRLTKMRVKDRVNFVSPGEYLALLGIKPMDKEW